ncbi:hypothetical protein [Haloarcula montana]|uniref:hypothetical protein n=1 Tax=Haloarcula montana TaxID=3111776 RepID=UPI002D78501C|nr:hypothetical protein [Haloarcula sp. GH36]
MSRSSAIAIDLFDDQDRIVATEHLGTEKLGCLERFGDELAKLRVDITELDDGLGV